MASKTSITELLMHRHMILINYLNFVWKNIFEYFELSDVKNKMKQFY